MDSQTENTNSKQQQQEASLSTGTTYVHQESESFRSKFAKTLLRVLGRKNALEKRLSAGLPGNENVPEPPNDLKKDLEVTSWQIHGRNIFLLAPRQNKTHKCVLFLHGGAYVHGATNYHWGFAKKLIEDLKCSVIFPDYPLAPQQSYLDAFKFMEDSYKDIISRIDPKDITLMGDSSGGGLALALTQKLKIEKVPQPSQLILLSPWLDVTLTNPDIIDADKDDIMLGVEGLKMAGKLYGKGSDDLNHYLLSPINGDLEGLPKMSVFMGTHDVLVGDARKLKRLCDEKNIAMNYYEYPKMIHDWMLAGFLPEAKKAIEQIEALL